jgi:arylformamidase
MTRWYDISMPLSADTIVYPGNPALRVSLVKAIVRGDSANVSEIMLGSHSGTHVDAQRHFFDAGRGVDEVAFDHLIGRALVAEMREHVRSIGPEELAATDLGSHTRVLFKTRNSQLLGQPVFSSDYTFLTPEGASYLVDRGVQLVGIDYLSVEQFHSGHHGAHLRLLEHGITIVEGLDLSEPPPGEYELICLPLRLVGLDGAPARAVLRGR